MHTSAKSSTGHVLQLRSVCAPPDHPDQVRSAGNQRDGDQLAYRDLEPQQSSHRVEHAPMLMAILYVGDDFLVIFQPKSAAMYA
jgi:hypothetical protein